MRLTPEDPRELGRYLALANVGLEMVAPVGLGVLLDAYLAWSPWGAAVGAVVGLTVGLTHLVMMSKRDDGDSGPRSGEPPRT